MKWIRQVFSWLFFKLLPPEAIMDAYNRRRTKTFANNLRFGQGFELGNSAVIHNKPEEATRIVVGDKTLIDGELLVFEKEGQITIGSHCYIGERSKVWSAASVFIGDHVLISHNVNIMDTNSHSLDAEIRARDYVKKVTSDPGDVVSKPIRILDHAWIGFNAIIMKGVTIGSGAIVAPGSIVTKDIPNNSLAAGTPAVVIRQTNPNETRA